MDTLSAWTTFINKNNCNIKQKEWIQFWLVVKYILSPNKNWKTLKLDVINDYSNWTFDEFTNIFKNINPNEYICKNYFKNDEIEYHMTLNDDIFDEVFNELDDEIKYVIKDGYEIPIERKPKYYPFIFFLQQSTTKKLFQLIFNNYYNC